MNVTQAADGVLRIASTAMSYAVKGVTTERGLDAGDFTLVAYGGAGPLHAVAVAREIGIRDVIIPGAPGVFSAFGMLFSDLRYDFVRTWYTRLADAPFDQVEKIYKELEDEGREAIKNTSVSPSEVTVKRAADMRYVGQEHAVTVDLPMEVFAKQDRAAIKKHFDDMHELRYGTCAPDEQAEIVSLRSTVTGVMAKPPQEKVKKGKAEPEKAAFTGNRKVFFQGGYVDTPTYARAQLLGGNKLKGPALIEEHASTTVVMPGDEVDIDDFGNIVIAVGGRR
jgi:N-methylhydantoinase A